MGLTLTFFFTYLLILASQPEYLIIGGYFNVTLNPYLEMYNSKDTAHMQSRKKHHSFIEELDICDPRKYPNKTEYSCCSL